MLTKKYILECLDKYCCFENLWEQSFEEQIVIPLRNNHCFNDWSWDSGASKGVLIFKELDFVIKIPFQGRASWIESHYEDESGEWRYSPSPSEEERFSIKIESQEEFWDFCEAHSAESDWDYCAVEAELAVSAEKHGVSNYFAKTELLGYAREHPVYIQEKCCMFYDEGSTTYKEIYKQRTKADYDSLKEVRERVGFYDINDDWILDFLIYWGEEALNKLKSFIHDYCIEDLHCGNIGYRHGVPCLVDYSGYYD